MKTIVEIRLGSDEGYHTLGYCATLAEAELHLNAWKRWWDQLNELQVASEGVEWDRLEALRKDLIDAIEACFANEDTGNHNFLHEVFENEDFPDFKCVEAKVGLDWPTLKLAETMPKVGKSGN